MILRRPCPICGSITAELLHRMEYAVSETEILPQEYNIVSCNACGFVFDDTCWNQEDYNRYYSQTSKYSGTEISGAGSLTEAERLRYNSQIDRFKEYIPSKNASIADIGCAKGGLLRVLQERGYNNLYGIDPSEANLLSLESWGIKGIPSALPSLQNVNVKFDLIILSHVLEHIYDLKTTVKSLVSLLNENGVLYIEVPNAESYSKSFLSPYYYFDSEHINHFSSHYLLCLFMGEGMHGVSSFNEDKHPYYACGCILIKGDKTGQDKTRQDKTSLSAYLKNMYTYLAHSHEQSISDRKILSSIEQGERKLYLWGASAYLRSQIKNGMFDRFNISGIIDKNDKMKGTFIPSSDGSKMIEIFTPSVLENEGSKEAVVFVTSVLYREQICRSLKEIKHRGAVYCF